MLELVRFVVGVPLPGTLDKFVTSRLYMGMNILEQNTIELLAPAGSVESFFAAVENGADAVFCGLDQFSARAKAKNFSLEEFELMKGYAGKRDVKVYVALNTLLQEEELPAMVELLETLEYLQVDGIIIQDLGLYQLARNFFPAIPLHASTQMLTHNLAGVLMLEQLGFKRVVLARELSIREITEIHEKSILEIEHFVHGAMCYSMSGHCLFSSYIDGRSGNRGRCIQPCRRRYHYKDESGFHFSTSDFSAIELIPDLIQAGVCSFKIEGRMKSAEYVASVVASYRMVIDAKISERKTVVKTAQETLRQAMGRSVSHGFLKGVKNKNLVLTKQKGGLGKIIGNVQRIQNGNISFTTDDVVHIGDRLRIQPDSDRAGSAFTVRALKIKNKSVKRVQKGNFLSVPVPKMIRVSSGDLVFKLSTGKSFTTSIEACRRRLSNAPKRYHEVHLQIECNTTELSVSAVLGSLQLEKKYNVEIFQAERSPLSMQTLKKVFSKTANPVLRLASLNAPDLPPVVIKPSRLKEVRRNFYQQLSLKFLATQKLERDNRIVEIKKEISQKRVSTGMSKQIEKLYLVTDVVNDLDAVEEYPDITFIIPLSDELLTAVHGKKIDVQRIIWDLPSITFDKDWQRLVHNVRTAISFGLTRFRVNSVSHIKLFEKHRDTQLIGGSWLYCMNSQAIQMISKLKIQQWSVSIEDDKANIEKLFMVVDKKSLLLTVYTPVDLFTSRIQPSVTKEKFILRNDKGGLLALTQSNGLTVTQSEKPFSLIGRLQSLRKMGCTNFILDLRGNGLLSEYGQEVLQAYYEDRSLASTTLFNFERGLM